MTRTKIFVSYSHWDCSWLNRLKIHLALLEREGAVHIWSDTRIGIGDRWRDEIEIALAESRIAVLIVSPDFLASEFIWREEIPRFIAHREQGLVMIPLIVRPCAWKISPELAELQARPRGGRPLALGTDAEVDLGFAEFVYELAARIQRLPEALASDEADSIRAWNAAASGVKLRPPITPDEGSGQSDEAGAPPIRRGQEWIGEYQPTGRRFTLFVQSQSGQEFDGRVVYTDDGSETLVEGKLAPADEGRAHQKVLEEVRNRKIDEVACTIAFQETKVQKAGCRSPELIGKYIGLMSSTEAAGIYIAREQVVGQLYLKLARSSARRSTSDERAGAPAPALVAGGPPRPSPGATARSRA